MTMTDKPRSPVLLERRALINAMQVKAHELARKWALMSYEPVNGAPVLVVDPFAVEALAQAFEALLKRGGHDYVAQIPEEAGDGFPSQATRQPPLGGCFTYWLAVGQTDAGMPTFAILPLPTPSNQQGVLGAKRSVLRIMAGI